MSAMSGLVGTQILLAPFGAIPGYFLHEPQHTQKSTEKIHILFAGPMDPIHPVWALASIHPRWGNRYEPISSPRDKQNGAFI